MLISPAFAQGLTGGGDGFVAFLPLILIFVVFYFLLIRPQMKRQKEHKNKLGSIRRGDKIVTGGGIIATVTRIGEGDQIDAEIASGVKVKVMRNLVADVLTKTEPVSSGKSDKAEDKDRKRGRGKSKPGDSVVDKEDKD